MYRSAARSGRPGIERHRTLLPRHVEKELREEPPRMLGTLRAPTAPRRPPSSRSHGSQWASSGRRRREDARPSMRRLMPGGPSP
eukprot:9271740-Pyramimonas_sp.AAC.2